MISVNAHLSLSFNYGKNLIFYNLLRARRKTLEIAVLPDCTVEVKAPLTAEIEQIELRLKKRGLVVVVSISRQDKISGKS